MSARADRVDAKSCDAPGRRHHLLIGGTGRAGTSFLVQYLAACGLDTHLTRARPEYDEDANAGLEDVPIGNADAPYVVKSPWLYEFADRLLADPEVVIDAVIVPMRDLVDAVTSRIVNEMRARRALASLPEDCQHWASWGVVPGGVVYSLNPIDQARLLALGFHQLLCTLVQHRVPVVLLDFPRFIDDADYLYTALAPVLGPQVTRERALQAHAAVAVADKVRVGRTEHAQATDSRPAADTSSGIAFPPQAAMEQAALARELARTRRQVAQLEQRVAQLQRPAWRRAASRLRAALRRLAGTAALRELPSAGGV
ncbi:MAG: hypothetical protein J7603_25625 [Pseudacidovorax sp.]|nr:hypothetical protein [Pseudacidovorax sp.]